MAAMIGFPMAKNLRAKIPEGDILVIHDVNKAATAKFVEDVGTGVEVLETPREVAERSVSRSVHGSSNRKVHMMSMFYR